MDPNQSGNQMVSNAVETNRAVEYNWMFLLFIHTLISFLLFFFHSLFFFVVISLLFPLGSSHQLNFNLAIT